MPANHPGRRPCLIAGLIAGLIVGLLGLVGLVGTTPAAAAPRAPAATYFGVDGKPGAALGSTPLSEHRYGQLAGAVPVARMITMGTGGRHWDEISAAEPGSSTYTQLVRWADVIQARGTTTLLTFAHEPEAKAGRGYGTAAGYVAAFRHVVDIFRAQGVTDVEWTWQMTGAAFRIDPGSPRYAAKWYPGDAYVDDVAADVYNWSDCRGTGPWVQMETLAAPMLEFARAHGKLAVLGEFASDAGPRRADWLDNVHSYLVTHADIYRAAFYFDHANDTDCTWALTSPADVDAFTAMAGDDHFSR